MSTKLNGNDPTPQAPLDSVPLVEAWSNVDKTWRVVRKEDRPKDEGFQDAMRIANVCKGYEFTWTDNNRTLYRVVCSVPLDAEPVPMCPPVVPAPQEKSAGERLADIAAGVARAQATRAHSSAEGPMPAGALDNGPTMDTHWQGKPINKVQVWQAKGHTDGHGPRWVDCNDDFPELTLAIRDGRLKDDGNTCVIGGSHFRLVPVGTGEPPIELNPSQKDKDALIEAWNRLGQDGKITGRIIAMEDSQALNAMRERVVWDQLAIAVFPQFIAIANHNGDRAKENEELSEWAAQQTVIAVCAMLRARGEHFKPEPETPKPQ